MWCLCQKLSLSPLYFNKTLLHKCSERSSLVSGPGLNSSPPAAKNPGIFRGSATTFQMDGRNEGRKGGKRKRWKEGEGSKNRKEGREGGRSHTLFFSTISNKHMNTHLYPGHLPRDSKSTDIYFYRFYSRCIVRVDIYCFMFDMQKVSFYWHIDPNVKVWHIYTVDTMYTTDKQWDPIV